VAGLLTLCLGMLATNGYPIAAVVVATAATLLLSLRQQLHGWLRALSETDVQATARFAIITAAILPLLPDRRFGPYDAWNPRELWLVVVLVTGFSFAGYIVNRTFGARRGILATAAIGGMYSSTAVTAVLARRLYNREAPVGVLAAGIALASAMMFLRILLLTAVLATSALPALAFATAPAALVAIVWGALAIRRSASEAGVAAEMAARNPFELLPALGFALLVAVMALFTRWAEARYGDAGVATLLMLTGSFDVDAAIVTLGGLPAGTLDAWVAGLVLAVPALVNTLFKAAIVVGATRSRLGLKAASPLLAAALVVAIALVLAVLRV
jgi:uncharacterized membrane protein (DUF4010 family)